MTTPDSISPTRRPPRVGHPDTCLIVLRGNSGSGKSSIARAVRARYGRGLALVEQDYLRRQLLKELDLPGGNAAELIAQTVRFALDAGYHVLCEGILHRDRYGPMLDQLRRAHTAPRTSTTSTSRSPRPCAATPPAPRPPSSPPRT